MRLHRGVSYQPTPPSLELTEREIQERHQPSGWACRTLAEMGVACSMPAKTVVDSSAPKVVSEVAQARSVIRPFSASKEVEKIHRVNIQRSLTRRIQIARERGDKVLLQALESELSETAALQ